MYSQQVFLKKERKGGRRTLKRLGCSGALTRSHLKPGPRPSSSVNGQPQPSPAPPPPPRPSPSLLCSPTSLGLLKTRHRLCLCFSLSIQDKQSAPSSGRTLGPLTKQSIILSAKPVWPHHGQGARLQRTVSLCASLPAAANLSFSAFSRADGLDHCCLRPSWQPQKPKKRRKLLGAPPPLPPSSTRPTP